MTPEVLPTPAPARPRELRALKFVLRLLSIAAVLVLTLGLLYGILSQSYPFRWNAALRHLPAFNRALGLTVEVSLAAMVVGMTLGLLIALARLSPFALVRDVGTLYVHTVRNIPSLVFILFMYFGVATSVVSSGATVPLFGVEVDARLFWGIIALSLFEASFISEIFRAGIQSIHPTQMEAARSLGMSYLQAMRYVVLPQATRVIIPPMTGELIALVKESALLMVISLPELTLTTKQLASQKPLQFEFYTILAAYYLSITLPLAGLSHLLERKLKIAGREER